MELHRTGMTEQVGVCGGCGAPMTVPIYAEQLPEMTRVRVEPSCKCWEPASAVLVRAEQAKEQRTYYPDAETRGVLTELR